MRRSLRPTVAAAAAALVLTGCGGGDEEPKANPTDLGGTPRASGSEIRLEAKDNVFVPERITAAAGETVVVRMRNTGMAPHTFTIKEFDVDAEANAGQTETITFTAVRSGTYRIVCTYHESAGMVGELRVT